MSELLTMVYERPAYLSLISQKEKLAQNTLKVYETIPKFSEVFTLLREFLWIPSGKSEFCGIP